MRSAANRFVLIAVAVAVSHFVATDRAVAEISLPALENIALSADASLAIFGPSGASATTQPAPEAADDGADWLPPWARQKAPLPLFVQQLNSGSPDAGMGANTVDAPTGGSSQAKLATGSLIPKPDLCLWMVSGTEVSLPPPHTLRLFRPPRIV